MRRRLSIASAAAIAIASHAISPATAQIASSIQPFEEAFGSAVSPAPSAPATQEGQTAQSLAGKVGQRQTREQVDLAKKIEPMERISSRIANRVQSRIRNRIDRNYSPQANAASPFAVAEDQTRTAGRPRRR